MELFKPLAPVIQVFLLIAAGFIFAHWKKISLSAVINFILTEKYRQDPGLAASIVVISTVISVLSSPLVLWLIL